MTIGKLSKSFKRRPTEDSGKSLGLTSIAFCHEFDNAGETRIDFQNLNPSNEWLQSGRVNPPIQDILGSNLRFFKNNIVLVSSSKGYIQASQYYVTGTSIEFKTFESEVGEVFEIQVLGNTSLGNMLVDSRPYKKVGILTEGYDEFHLGVGVKIFPEQITVFKDGVALTRNSDNSSTNLDGDYYMTDPSSVGISSTIKFNQMYSTDVEIMVMLVGTFAERPTLSMMSELETIATQLDNIIPTVAALAGVPEGNFRNAANYPDLYAFSQVLTKATTTKSIELAGDDIDWSEGFVFWKEIDTNTTFTFSNIADGKVVTLIVKNIEATDRTITLPSGLIGDPNVDLIVEPSKENIYTFVRSNGKTYVSYVSQLVEL